MQYVDVDEYYIKVCPVKVAVQNPYRITITITYETRERD